MSSFIALRRATNPIPARCTAGQHVDLVGTGTAWTGSTSFVLSGVTPLPTIVTTIVQPDGVHARLKIATGAVLTRQTLTISDGTSTATVTVGPAAAARGRYMPGLFRR